MVGDSRANFLLLNYKIPEPWRWGEYSTHSEALPSSRKIFIVSEKLLIMASVGPFFKGVFLFDKMAFYYL